MTKAQARKMAMAHFPEVFSGESRNYRIIRFRFDGKPRTIKSGLTLAEAQAHCRRPDTSSHSTGPGAWFDGYGTMRGR